MADMDAQFMQRAINLAQLGAQRVASNPMVGAVIVHKNRIIGEGWHAYYGGPHAEVNAVLSVNEPALLAQSTLYCTLEPCFHFGKTPPCVDLILQKNIRRVVVGAQDLNPLTGGKSLAKMRAHGVEVRSGVLEAACTALNPVFNHHVKSNASPYIVHKWAQSSDGLVGKTGQRIPISGAITQRLVHRWRSEFSAILVGTQTAIVDNPQLDSRYYSPCNPLRIAIDFEQQIPITHHILDDSTATWMIGQERPGNWRNTRFIMVEKEHAIAHLLDQLRLDKMPSLLVEGGAALHQLFINQGFANEFRVITNHRPLIDGISAPLLPRGFYLANQTQIGDDNIDWYLPN